MVAVFETVTHKTRVLGGKEYSVTITRRKGLDTYTERTERNGQIIEEQILADEATFIDWGSKLGVTRNYTLHKDYTEEERAAGRRHIQEVAAKILIDQGIW